MTAILDRIGLARFWEWLRTRRWPWRRRRAITDGHKETARETRVALGLMAEAASAGGQMTDEQRMFMAQSAPGMRAREARLLAIPNRSLVEENELLMIRREMAVIEGRDAPPAASRPMGLLGTVGAANPLLGLAMNPMTWMVIGLVGLGGANAFTGMRLDHAKRDLTEARADLRSTEAALETAREVNERLARDIRAADLQTRETAANLEAERARHARAAAIERRRQREIQNVLTGRDPPAWSLRDDGDGPPAPGDDSSAPAGDPG